MPSKIQIKLQPYQPFLKSDIQTSIAHGPQFDISITHTQEVVIGTSICYRNSQTSPAANSSQSPRQSPNDIHCQLEDYLNGIKVDFCVDIVTPQLTAFGIKIITTLAKIPYSQRITYGQLAQKAGFPLAARAVGSVMRKNPVPVIIPCHRIISANGLGNYSGGKGVETKKALLMLEGII